MDYNIILIGFMGTGKSVIGRRLARKLNYRFVDTDSEIEEITGKTINKIFRQDGEIRFRSEEKLLLKRLADQKNMVISTGGGMVLDKCNAAQLQTMGIIICLEASPEIIYQRVIGNNKRPLLNRQNTSIETIKEMLEKRREAYSIAEFTVDTGYDNINESVNTILAYLKEKDYAVF